MWRGWRSGCRRSCARQGSSLLGVCERLERARAKVFDGYVFMSGNEFIQ